MDRVGRLTDGIINSEDVVSTQLRNLWSEKCWQLRMRFEYTKVRLVSILTTVCGSINFYRGTQRCVDGDQHYTHSSSSLTPESITFDRGVRRIRVGGQKGGRKCVVILYSESGRVISPCALRAPPFSGSSSLGRTRIGGRTFTPGSKLFGRGGALHVLGSRPLIRQIPDVLIRGGRLDKGLP